LGNAVLSSTASTSNFPTQQPQPPLFGMPRLGSSAFDLSAMGAALPFAPPPGYPGLAAFTASSSLEDYYAAAAAAGATSSLSGLVIGSPEAGSNASGMFAPGRVSPVLHPMSAPFSTSVAGLRPLDAFGADGPFNPAQLPHGQPSQQQQMPIYRLPSQFTDSSGI